ncbi:MAG: TetR/AcrR family transcriptional regulator [Vulcanibacillus sp.]|jgi:AcrR family transcriptional regulator
MKDTKEYIIDEAHKLFLKHSYEAVSISDISQAIGLTKGSLYHHFKNKEELFKSVIDKSFLIQSVFGQFDVENTSLKQLNDKCIENFQNILNQLFGNDDEFDSINYLSLLVDSFRHYPGYREDKFSIFDTEIERIKIVLKNAIKNKEIRDDINTSIMSLNYISSVVGIAGHFLHSNSISLAISSMRDQLDELYKLMKK